MPLQLRYVTHSEIGLIRKNNQDSGYAGPHLLVVADGMGGAAAGDLASAVAIDTLRALDVEPEAAGAADAPESKAVTGPDQDVESDAAPDAPAAQPGEAAADTESLVVDAEGEDDPAGEPTRQLSATAPMLHELAGGIQRANDRIAGLIEANLTLDGMGTTVTGIVFDGEQVGIAHIGDSRAYLYRDSELIRLTHDHSWVQSLVDDGKISAAEAAVHPHRSLLLKVLNGQPGAHPDVSMQALQAGDRLMLCSDGICGLVDDPRIAEALALESAQEAVDELVSDALSAGGIDNLTVIVADVVDGPGTADPVVLGAAAEREVPPPAARVAREPSGTADRSDDTRPLPAIPAAADEERYSPQAPLRWRRMRTLIALLVLVLIAGAGLGAAFAWTRTQFYVGASGDQVAIFQGLPDSVPGLRLSRVYEVQELPVASLPPFYQEKVAATIEVATLDAARQTVAELTEAARRCATQRKPKPKPTPSVSPSASASTTKSPATPQPSAPTASPSPSPSSPAGEC